MQGVPQLFETTIGDETVDLALAITSVPLPPVGPSQGASRIESRLTPDVFLREVRLYPVAEIPAARLSDAIAALLATRDVADTEAWLRQEPDPVPLLKFRVDEPWISARAFQLDEGPSSGFSDADALVAIGSSAPERLKKRPKDVISKREAVALGYQQFARESLAESVVPFRRSPLDVYAMPDLLQAAGALRVFLVTARSNPMLAIELAGGYLLYSAVRGTGQGIRTGLAEGVRYRILRLLAREQADAPPAAIDEESED